MNALIGPMAARLDRWSTSAALVLLTLAVRHGGPRVGRALADQFAHPHGPVGRLVGRIMARVNDEMITWVVAQLDLAPDADVLEIGCGPGLGLERCLARVSRGRVIGLDLSPEMPPQAARRNKDPLRAGRAGVLRGDSGALPFRDRSLDLVLLTNVVCMLADPLRDLAEMRRVLRPGGRVALAYTDKSAMNDHGGVLRLYDADEGVALLHQAGFRRTVVHTQHPATGTDHCVAGERPLDRRSD